MSKQRELKVWKANRLDQEETLTESDLIDSWSCCKWTQDASLLPAKIVHDDIPTPVNVARHASICMGYTFDQEPFMELYDAVRARL